MLRDLTADIWQNRISQRSAEDQPNSDPLSAVWWWRHIRARETYLQPCRFLDRFPSLCRFGWHLCSECSPASVSLDPLLGIFPFPVRWRRVIDQLAIEVAATLQNSGLITLFLETAAVRLGPKLTWPWFMSFLVVAVTELPAVLEDYCSWMMNDVFHSVSVLYRSSRHLSSSSPRSIFSTASHPHKSVVLDLL